MNIACPGDALESTLSLQGIRSLRSASLSRLGYQANRLGIISREDLCQGRGI